jgi:hypothetical protein
MNSLLDEVFEKQICRRRHRAAQVISTGSQGAEPNSENRSRRAAARLKNAFFISLSIPFGFA